MTALLLRWGSGDARALEALLPLVYDEMRRIARAAMRKEPEGRLLQPTALVHEVYLRLFAHSRLRLQDRRHFYSLVALLMRRCLISDARQLKAHKRGGGALLVSLDEVAAQVPEADDQLAALDDALQRLMVLDPRLCRVVELRHVAGLSIEETAAALALSPATVKRDSSTARAWLYRELLRGSEDGPGPLAAGEEPPSAGDRGRPGAPQRDPGVRRG